MKATVQDFEQMLNIGDVTVTVAIENPDGSSREIKLSSPEDFVNDVVTNDVFVSLVYKSGRIFSGFFNGVEEYDGEIVIFLKSAKSDATLLAWPCKNLLGYYCDDEQ